MPLSPLCLVKDGIGAFVPTTNGVDVTPSNLISIKLADTTGVVDWFLQVVGTDELTPLPLLSGVNVLTHQVTGPSTVVTFTFPGAQGRAIGFRSQVTGIGGPIITTFGVYSLTSFVTRVGFVTETREGSSSFGWATKVNPLIRTGGGGGGSPDNYSLTGISGDKTVPDDQAMLYDSDVLLNTAGNLILEGDTTSVHTEDNFSVLYIPLRGERIVQQNDELLFTDDLVIDGQLTVDGQLVDATPYDGYDILNALTAVGGGFSRPWSTITGPGTFTLEVGKINKYTSGSGLTLLFPAAPNDGDELEIKETTASGGTAPDTVTLDTGSGSIDVENIGLGGNTQTDLLTEYKTWIKYKYDSGVNLWRIVGAAYQLP